MTTMDQLSGSAVNDLKSLGLSEYAARTLVTLTRIGGGTARAVSDASAVPRTRVYDAIDELEERGLVTVTDVDPQRFSPVAPRAVKRVFYAEYVYRMSTMECALSVLDPDSVGPDVSARLLADDVEREAELLDAVESATSTVSLVLVDESLSEVLLEALRESEGVSLRVAVTAAVDTDRISDAVPGATLTTVPDAALPLTDGGLLLQADDRFVLDLDEAGDSPTADVALAVAGDDDLVGSLSRLVDLWFEGS